MAAHHATSGEWSLQANDYTLLGKLHSRPLVTVWLAKVQGNASEKYAAVKIINYGGLSEGQAKAVSTQCRIMSVVDHLNVVKCKAIFQFEEAVWMVMKLHAASVREIANELFPFGFPTSELIATILHDALAGLSWFHTNGHIHRDIKAANILLGFDGVARIYDFGIVATLGPERHKAKTMTGSPAWMAPEVFHGEATVAADIWSLGITTLELAYGSPPHVSAGKEVGMLMVKILESDPPTLDSVCAEFDPAGEIYHLREFDASLDDFLSCALVKDDTGRATAEQLREHVFIKTFARDAEFMRSELVDKLPAHILPDARIESLEAKLMGSSTGGESDAPVVVAQGHIAKTPFRFLSHSSFEASGEFDSGNFVDAELVAWADESAGSIDLGSDVGSYVGSAGGGDDDDDDDDSYLSRSDNGGGSA